MEESPETLANSTHPGESKWTLSTLAITTKHHWRQNVQDATTAGLRKITTLMFLLCADGRQIHLGDNMNMQTLVISLEHDNNMLPCKQVLYCAITSAFTHTPWHNPSICFLSDWCVAEVTVFVPIMAQGASKISHFGWALFVSKFVAMINPQIYDFGHFQANFQSYWTQFVIVSWTDLDRWLIILWFIASNYDEWALIGVWAAIRMNMIGLINFRRNIMHCAGF